MRTVQSKTFLSLALAVAVIAAAAAPVVRAEAPKDRAELTKAIAEAKVPLQAGLAVSAKTGKPISAKYELDHGTLQLSVYTAKAGKFAEVIVDNRTGRIEQTEPITEGEDFAAARAQSEAMAKASVSLQTAVAKAVSAHKGYKAVSVYPSVKDGKPVAEVTLANGADWKAVAETLR
jgi:hypothetical protein